MNLIFYFSVLSDKAAGATHTQAVGGVDAGRQSSRGGLLLPGTHSPTHPQCHRVPSEERERVEVDGVIYICYSTAPTETLTRLERIEIEIETKMFGV